MSKKLNDILNLVNTANDQLFDRYINFTLSSAIDGVKDITFITPKFGLKPNITVSGKLASESAVHDITLTVYNISENIDYNQYGYVEIEAGYYSSGMCTKFKGMITNCYMAKPNPNGELVVSCTLANVPELFKTGLFSVKFNNATLFTKQLVEECFTNINKAAGTNFKVVTRDLPPIWLTQSFHVNYGTYNFQSPLDCITWLNSMFLSHCYNRSYAGSLEVTVSKEAKLTPITVNIDIDNPSEIVITGLYKNGLPVVKSLTNIGSAYLTAGSTATVTAPFIPDLRPGEFIYLDPKYFRTRLNIQALQSFTKAVANAGNIWAVTTMQFTFSTFTTNTMTLLLTNVNNDLKIGAESE